MLQSYSIHPSLATADIERARRWYEEKLGLVPENAFEAGLIYRVEGRIFTVYRSPSAGTARNTVAGWRVDDLRSEVARLRARGVVFEDYDFGDRRTVDGIDETADGLNAWFKDADGNVIALAESRGKPNPRVGFIAVLAASDLARAKAWYADRLGLVPTSEFDGLTYETGRTSFNVYETSSAGTAQNTVAVWRVERLSELVAELRARGVVFEDYDLGDVRTVNGILADADGTRNAWFKDSEGNILGLAEDPSLPLH